MYSLATTPDGYIEDDKGKMIVRFHIQEHKNGVEYYQLSWKEPGLLQWTEKPLDSLTLGTVFDMGEEKADQYLGIERTDYTKASFPGLEYSSRQKEPSVKKEIAKGQDKEM